MTPVQQLSTAGRAEIKALSGPRPLPFLWTAITAWLTIGLAISAAIYLDNIFVTIAAIYIVATRQNILALLVHEQTHYLGLNSRFGDWIANLLVAYPLIALSIEGYSKIHLRHHRFYFTMEDPDFHRKNGDDWLLPMSRKRLAMLFLADLTGVSFVRFLFKKPLAFDGSAFKRRNPSPAWLKPVFFLVVGTVLTLVHGWLYFLLFWMLPLATIFTAIVRWGALCEHVYGKEGATVEENSPVIIPTLMSKIFLPNLNFAMHAYHHYFPGVSFSNLPALHAVFEREGLIYRDMVFRSQWEYLCFLVSPSHRAQAVEVQDMESADRVDEAVVARA